MLGGKAMSSASESTRCFRGGAVSTNCMPPWPVAGYVEGRPGPWVARELVVEDGEAGEVEVEEQILIPHSVKEALDLARGDPIADRRMAAKEPCPS